MDFKCHQGKHPTTSLVSQMVCGHQCPSRAMVSGGLYVFELFISNTLFGDLNPLLNVNV